MSAAIATPADLRAAADAAVDWLRDAAAPRWALPPGADLHPEKMARDGTVPVCDARVFVQARHVYAYCTLGALGWTGAWRDETGRTADALIARARRDDGFYVHALTPAGGVADGRADLYDQAFVLFALAHAGRALGRDDLVAAAEALAGTIVGAWRHRAGGFVEGEIKPAPRRQNPHMHLLEAVTTLAETSGAARWAALADEIAALAEARFVDAATGALTEYFTDDLAPLAGEEGRIVEPGHCFEWSWLFEWTARRGRDTIATADRLAAFARRHGIDPARGVAIGEVTLDGVPRDRRGRLWPQTERLKCALARYERTAAPAEIGEAVAAWAGLALYLDPEIPGTWTDKSLPGGGFVDEPVPGSSLYHIACAVAELARVAASAGPEAPGDGKRR